MIKIQLLSDIHLEYFNDYPGLLYFVKPIAPILVLAGDICYYKHKHFLTFFQEASFYFKYVVFVPGNHEYYTNTEIDIHFKDFDIVNNNIRNKLKHLTNVKMLQKQSFTLNNVKFLGTTLWYDTPASDKRFDGIVYTQNENFILYNNHLMPDPSKICRINRSQYNWLSNELNDCKDVYTVVITHYLPSEKCISPLFKNSPDNYLFYTTCNQLFKKVNTWIYGHTHIGQQQYIDTCLVLGNPRGLQKEQNIYHDYKYNKECIIEIPFNSSI
jgi:predicted phosphodiesterase